MLNVPRELKFRKTCFNLMRMLEISCTSEISERVIACINKELGDDVKNLKKIPGLFKKVSQQKRSLESEYEAASSEAPCKITNTLIEAKNVIQRINEIDQSECDLRSRIDDHLIEADSSVKHLRGLQDNIDLIEKYMKYLKWILHVDEISSNIQAAMVIRADGRAVSDYQKLLQLSLKLETSQCLHLLEYIDGTVLFWHNLLKKKFGSELEENLNAIKWPIVTTSQLNTTPEINVQVRQESLNKIELLFDYLLQLQLPEGKSKKEVSKLMRIVPEFRPQLIPLQMLVNPLRKRFIYHFMGKKQTNSLEKPEWFFTQVLSWIRDNSLFLEQVIQPILIKNNFSQISAKVEFIKGLVEAISEKLHNDIPQLLDDDHLLSHTIDEALLFDKELHSMGYSGMDSQPGCLTILTAEEICFSRWINMERKYAIAKIDNMFSSTCALKPIYVTQGDVDELKVPECGEQFMTLIYTITGRYKCVPQPIHKLKFLNLQLDLLDDFRLRIVQLMKGQEPSDSSFSSKLNAVNYIITILNEWGDLPFFLQMQCYKKKCKELTDSFGTSELASTSKKEQEEVVANQLASINKSGLLMEMMPLMNIYQETVFDEVTGLFKHVQSEMIFKVIECVVMDVKAKSREYRNEKWFSMKSSSNMSVSSSFCSMLMILQSHFQKLKLELAEDVFTSTWQGVATSLNSFILEEVILLNVFNQGGAAQLNYDMNRNLFPLFSEFTQRPENYFKEVKESCILLTLAQGSAMLLLEVLVDETNSDRSQALAEIGVHLLKPELAVKILWSKK